MDGKKTDSAYRYHHGSPCEDKINVIADEHLQITVFTVVLFKHNRVYYGVYRWLLRSCRSVIAHTETTFPFLFLKIDLTNTFGKTLPQ
jgi:hypothetical protein